MKFEAKIPEGEDPGVVEDEEEIELPLWWCGKLVGTVYIKSDGHVHAELDPDLVDEEEVEVIMAGGSHFSVKVRE